MKCRNDRVQAVAGSWAHLHPPSVKLCWLCAPDAVSGPLLLIIALGLAVRPSVGEKYPLVATL